MKRVLHLLFLLIPFAATRAQTSQVTVNGNNSSESFNDVKFDSSGGGTVKVGVINNNQGNGNDLFIVKMGLSNNIIWQKAFANPGDDAFYRLLLCKNGDYLAVGQIFINGVRRAVAIRFNSATGDIVWQQASSNFSAGELFWDATELPNGNLVIVGVDNFIGGGSNGFIMVLNQAGAKVWSGVSNYGSSDEFKTVALLSNGRILVSGFYSNGSNYNAEIIEMDPSNGNILAQNAYSISASFPGGVGFVNSIWENQSFVRNNKVLFALNLFQGFGTVSNLGICTYDQTTKSLTGNVYYHPTNNSAYSYSIFPMNENDMLVSQSFTGPFTVFVSRITNNSVAFDKRINNNVKFINGIDVNAAGRAVFAGGYNSGIANDDGYALFSQTDVNTGGSPACSISDVNSLTAIPINLPATSTSIISLNLQAGSMTTLPIGSTFTNDISTTICSSIQPGTGTGLQGVYYNGTVLSGVPLLTRVDTTIDFELTYSKQPVVLSPAPGIVPEDKYSVRWTGQVQPMYSETYTFSALTDDGVRLWVNGVQLIDNWTNQAATEKSGSITLQAGQKYDIILEYFENTGEAITKLYWASASTPKQIIPKTQLYPLAVAPPPGSGNGLKGVYYNGTNLQGTPLLTRVDSLINFEFTYSKQPVVLSPAPGLVPEDQYSVRWTGQVLAQKSETYTFYALTDDGVRLWVNGVQLIDNWVNQGATEKSGTINLVAGQKYDIILEYFENTGEAVTKLYWSSPGTLKQIIPSSQLFPGDVAPPPTGNGNGLQGVYYSGTSLSGTPLLTRVDPTINFELTYSKQPVVLSPAPGIVPEDQYSVRWTGQVQAQFSETYTFYTLSDDGIRLWVNGVQLVDNWVNQGATEKSGSITLQAGQKYDIVVEYFENTGEAVTKLSWSSASTPKQIIPSGQLFPAAIAPPPPPANNNGLAGVYYSGTNLLGTPLLTRIDTTINFELTYSKQPVVLSPAPGIVPEDQYSVRWTGQVQPLYSETYTFYTLSDDGIRLWVNGVQLVDNWVNQGATEKSGSIPLLAGQKYDIVIEYYENTGEAVTKLLWSSPSTPKQIVPKSQLFPPVGNGGRLINLPTMTAATTAPAFYVALNPNPVVAGQPARLQVSSSHISNLQVAIYASSGRMMRSQRINNNAGTNIHSVGTSDLRPGFYFVTVTGGDKPVTLKLVVQ